MLTSKTQLKLFNWHHLRYAFSVSNNCQYNILVIISNVTMEDMLTKIYN